MINVMYHRNCFDGMAAAWVCWREFGDGAKYIPVNYGDDFTNLYQDCYENANINDRYVIVDFSFPRDLMELIASKAESIIVLDHHQTAQKNCEGLDFCKFDMNESGASLAWKYFNPNQPMPWLVQYIADRDLWKFQMDGSEAINAFIQSFPMNIQEYNLLAQKLNSTGGLEDAALGGASILRYKNQNIQIGANNAWEGTIAGHRIHIANATMLFSEIGNELCKRFPNEAFSAYFTIRPDGRVQWGLRSIGDFDVSEVAKRYNGGGHRNAAGFIREEINFKEF